MARAVGVTRSWEWLEERSETSEAMGSTTMEDYPRQKDALLTVVERLTTPGERDDSPYELFDYLLASKSEPA
jgi:hypothetical protein